MCPAGDTDSSGGLFKCIQLEGASERSWQLLSAGAAVRPLSSLEAGGELFSPWQTPVSPQWDLSLQWPWWHSQCPAWFFSKKPASASCHTQSLGRCWDKFNVCSGFQQPWVSKGAAAWCLWAKHISPAPSPLSGSAVYDRLMCQFSQ